MPGFYPTHPEPGDPPGFYGEVYFDGQNVTDRRKPGADPSHYQMTEWYVPDEPDTSTGGTTSDASTVAVVQGITITGDSTSDSAAAPISSAPTSPALTAPMAEPANLPLTRPNTAAGHHRAAAIRAAALSADTDQALNAADTDQAFTAADTAATDTSATPPNLSDQEILALYQAVVTALDECPTEILQYDRLANSTVQQLQRINGDIARLTGVRMAISTDQIAQRSAADLAGRGMARQFGDRTAIEMAKNLGGLTQQEVMAAVNAGRMMRDIQSTPPDTTDTVPAAPPAGDNDPIRMVERPAPPVGPTEPWLRAVSAALAADVLSPAQATAIRTGLGTPTESIPATVLAIEAARLVDEARTLTPDKVWKLARQTRDRLDRDGVALRETERHRMRSARLTIRPDGMMHLSWLIDPEQGMQLKTLCDRITSPKRGGPRTGDSHTAQRLKDDPRESDQLLSDHLFHFLQAGAGIDPSSILATPTASVVVLTTQRRRYTATHTSTGAGADADGSATIPGTTVTDRRNAIDDGTGATGSATATGTPTADGSIASGRPTHAAGTPNPHDPDVEHHSTGQHTLGWIDGHPDPLSPETVDRLICEGSTHEVVFSDELLPLDVSSEQRLFGRKQRIGLGAQFGGCTWTDENGNRSCDRPPSWSEAHHIEHWYRDKGKTVMSNGILLCKSHHLQLHNDHWEIIRKGNRYWLIPPSTVAPARTPRLIPTHCNVHHDLLDDTA